MQEWKKSSARCGADVALSLVRVHCKEAKEDKLAALKVANTKKHSFQDFMDTFLEAATRIADRIDLFCLAEGGDGSSRRRTLASGGNVSRPRVLDDSAKSDSRLSARVEEIFCPLWC